jgi:hypothetical protein
MTDPITVCRVDAGGHYLFHQLRMPYEAFSEVDLLVDPPSPYEPEKHYQRHGSQWVEVEEVLLPEPPPTPYDAVQLSKIEFRRLLLPKEALWFDAALSEPPMTSEQLDEAFDPNTTTTQLQLLAAKRDAMMQWGLLDDLVELNHDDTRDFLYVMAACGMFGSNAGVRLGQILSRSAPQ